jgi:hypothetical protein
VCEISKKVKLEKSKIVLNVQEEKCSFLQCLGGGMVKNTVQIRPNAVVRVESFPDWQTMSMQTYDKYQLQSWFKTSNKIPKVQEGSQRNEQSCLRALRKLD